MGASRIMSALAPWVGIWAHFGGRAAPEADVGASLENWA